MQISKVKENVVHATIFSDLLLFFLGLYYRPFLAPMCSYVCLIILIREHIDLKDRYLMWDSFWENLKDKNNI